MGRDVEWFDSMPIKTLKDVTVLKAWSNKTNIASRAMPPISYLSRRTSCLYLSSGESR